jgi:hypothetical protein
VPISRVWRAIPLPFSELSSQLQGTFTYISTSPLIYTDKLGKKSNGCMATHMIKGKGKAIPLQAWTGPEGSRRMRLPDFKTFGTPVAFTFQEIPLVLISVRG